MTHPITAPSGPISPPRTLFGWALPFLVVGAAIGAHWMLNVPEGPLPPPVPEEAKKPDPERGGDDHDRKSDEKEPLEPFTTPRTPGLLTQLWDVYDPVEFKAEPTFDAWSVAHRPLINQIVSAARLHTFKGVSPAPSVSCTNVECHTVRCRFVLTSARAEDVEAVLATLEGLQLGGATAWHKFVPDPVSEEPTKRKGSVPRMRAQVMASFIRDLPPLDQITLRDGTKLKQPPPATAPATTPAPAPAKGAAGSTSSTTATPKKPLGGARPVAG